MPRGGLWLVRARAVVLTRAATWRDLIGALGECSDWLVPVRLNDLIWGAGSRSYGQKRKGLGLTSGSPELTPENGGAAALRLGANLRVRNNREEFSGRRSRENTPMLKSVSIRREVYSE